MITGKCMVYLRITQKTYSIYVYSLSYQPYYDHFIIHRHYSRNPNHMRTLMTRGPTSLLVMVETEYPFSTRVITRLLDSKFNRGIMKKFEYSSRGFL